MGGGLLLLFLLLWTQAQGYVCHVLWSIPMFVRCCARLFLSDVRCLSDAVHANFCNGTVRTAASARTELWLPQVLEFAKSAGISRWTSKLSACSRVSGYKTSGTDFLRIPSVEKI